MSASRLHVTGIVQGVGFRPFVQRLALQLDLPGSVRNTANGVDIEVPETSANVFQQRLVEEQPRLARIDSITVERCESNLANPFEIQLSLAGDSQTGVAPDAAICVDCLAELDDPNNRRYQYPFLNCTNCGPRFSIVHGIPYDRSKTTLSGFELCTACRAEYDDVNDRRFHAQAVACPDCGPNIWFEAHSAADKQTITGQNGLHKAVALLQSGGVLAVRGIGGFHLACLASDDAAVARLRELKSRPTKPFATMVRDIEVAREYADVCSSAQTQLLSPEAPIVLLPIKDSTNLAPTVISGLGKLGIMLPYSPLHHLLLASFTEPLVMTSGNIGGKPQITSNRAALNELTHIADGWLLHNRKIENRIDDSVVQMTRSKSTQVLRRARGLAPDLIKLPKGFDNHATAIAFGADSKNAFALAKGGQAILSQHMGDLSDFQTAQELLEHIARLTDLFDVEPQVVMCDLHDGYHASRLAKAYAEEQALPIIKVQHHHAHVASLMAEHQLDLETEIVAFVQDGIGMGTGGNLWGAEVLQGNYESVKRIATLAPASLPGGDKAAQEPWRNLAAQLLAQYGAYECWPREYQAALADHPVKPVCAAIQSGINAPMASSAGRLFDAVAAALGYAPARQSFEGEAAMHMEQAAASYIKKHGFPDPLPLTCEWDGPGQNLLVVGPGSLWDALKLELAGGAPDRAAASFHLGWADAWAQVAVLSKTTKTVALSGGSFQNQLISNRLDDRLRKLGVRVLQHRIVPPNDGGIALGQLMVGLAASVRSLANPN